MRAIQQACINLEKGYQPAITFIVVQKRHHARFFAMNDKDKVSDFFPQEMIQILFFLLHGLNFGQISNTVVLICDRMVKAPVELWAERSPTLIILIVFYSRMY